MLDEFQAWLRLNEQRLADRGVQVTLKSATTGRDNNSVSANLDTARYVSTIILWESGACDRYILEVETGDAVLPEHSMLQSTHELHSTLEAFCQRLLE